MARRTRMTHRLTERWLRAELLKLRNEQGVMGMTVRQVADATGMHPRTIERIEVGPERISADSLEKLLHVYKVGPRTRIRLRDMQGLANSVGWWDAWRDDDLSPAYIEHCELEEVADGIDLYVTTMFHGLVQCEEYARWAQGLSPVPHLRQGQSADRMIELRMQRQTRFRDHGCPLRLLIDEAVLLVTRGPMTSQMSYLRKLEDQGVLHARVLPASDVLAIPDTFGMFSAGDRKVLCLGVFVEHHAYEDAITSKVQEIFDLGWQQARSLLLS